MKKLEIIRAIMEMVGMNLMSSSDGFKYIEKIMEYTKYGIHKKLPEKEEVKEDEERTVYERDRDVSIQES